MAVGRGRALRNFVAPEKAGTQGMGVSFDKLRTNELSVYLPLSAPSGRGGQAKVSVACDNSPV